MPAHVRTEQGLAVTFFRDGTETDREVTATGELAVLAGVAILIRHARQIARHAAVPRSASAELLLPVRT
jgi:hypothetical protein